MSLNTGVAGVAMNNIFSQYYTTPLTYKRLIISLMGVIIFINPMFISGLSIIWRSWRNQLVILHFISVRIVFGPNVFLHYLPDGDHF